MQWVHARQLRLQQPLQVVQGLRDAPAPAACRGRPRGQRGQGGLGGFGAAPSAAAAATLAAEDPGEESLVGGEFLELKRCKG